MNEILATLLIVVAAANLIVAFSVLTRATHDSLRWAFLLLVSFVAIWSWGVSLFMVAGDIAHGQLYVNSYYIAALAIGGGLYMFGGKERTRAWWVGAGLVFLPAIALMALLLIEPTWLVEVVATTGPLSDRVRINFLHYSLFAALFLGVFGYGWWRIHREHRGQIAKRRSQMVVSMGVLTSGVFGVLFNLALPWVGIYDYIAIGPLFSVLFIVSVTYASVKYSLFDLRKTFVMSVAYLLASSVAVLAYIAAVWAVGSVIAAGSTSETVVSVVYAALALGVALTIEPLKSFFNRMTASLFLREQHSPEEALDSFGDAILDDLEISSIANKAMGVINSVVHSSFCAIVLLEKGNPMSVQAVFSPYRPKAARLYSLSRELDAVTVDGQVAVIEALSIDNPEVKRLARMGAGAVVRMQIKDQTIGYVVVGEKRSGDAYSTSERFMFATMADEAALAIANSQRFDEIQSFNARLKKEVAAATRELRDSNAKLRKMDATKDEFVSMASHQLRTPLTSIKGYISMVLEGDAGKISAQQRQLLNEAFTSSERMVRLIGDFLNVSRLQTGKFIIDRHHCDLALIVKQEVESIRRIADTHEIAVSFAKPARFPLLYLDEGKLRQVIMNFIDNAIYYSPDGTKITVTLTIEDGDAVLRVKDQGIGVPPEEQEHLFTKFFRARNARTQRPDGTGIGLYLAKRIIVGHGGGVVFESSDRGSVFGFRLPITKLGTPPPPSTDSDSAAA